MTAQKPTGDRDVVPRWRSVRRTVETGEFQRLADPRVLNPRHLDEIENASRAWESDPSMVSAAEFVGVSLVAGQAERASGAAAYLQGDGTPELLRKLGSRALEPSTTAGLDHGPSGAIEDDVDSAGYFHQRLGRQKARLAVDPRNPVAWSDLGRRYTALGQFRQAERALKVALALAPSSRYLLRSAARFYVHIGRPEIAFDMLSRCARTTEDPWLMAAYLSVGSVADAGIGSLRAARRILENDNYRTIERAELASELATFELRAGADRKARSLFTRSLDSPTDNSLAQVEWATHRLGALELELDGFAVPFAAEAFARSAAEAGEWAGAIEYSREWLEDQPFDTGAANLASYVSSVGNEDFDQAIWFAEFGLRAQPHAAGLVNNLAYALIESGRLDDAARALGRLQVSAVESSERVALLATHGLLSMRLGDFEAGRDGYEAAMRLARRLGDRRAEAMARTMLLREVLGLESPETIESQLASVKQVSTQIGDPGLSDCVARVELLLTSRRAG